MGCSGSRMTDHSLHSPVTAEASERRKRADTMDTGGRPQQWEHLRNQYDLVDPADVQATVDEWMDDIIHRNLSGTYVTFVLRKLRKLKKLTPNKSGVFGAVNKQIAPKPTTLTPSLLQRIVPESPMRDNIIYLMMQLGDRTLIDLQTRELAKLEEPATVQKIQSICNRFSVTEHPDTTTLHAVMTILGLANGTRAQKLKVLFYSCLEKLPTDFFPAFLLEPEDKVLSLQSLLHYHYHGTGKRNFVPSPTKPPVKALGKFLKCEGLVQESTDEEDTNATEDSDVMQAIFKGTESDLMLDIQEEFTLTEFLAFAKEHWDDDTLDAIMYRFFGQGMFPTPRMEQELIQGSLNAKTYRAFGGLGNYDGQGGLGGGVLYVIPKPWWDQWNQYVSRKGSRKRPPPLDTDGLLSTQDGIVRGVCGSYEFLRSDLTHGRDFVLIPPIVWDRLYELYSGGPPLPRMVVPGTMSNPTAVPSKAQVILHPWILQIILCDPVQPYRRHETGSTSIRIMVEPKQPMWRVMGEIMCRFPQAQNTARLWKKVAVENGTIMSRYGPYRLLVKTGHVLVLTDETMEEAAETWKEYTSNQTVEGTGLVDGDTLLLEYSVFNKSSELTWPRLAAAEDGRVRRLAEEDQRFRQTLRGLDDKGNVMLKPPQLVGMSVDAQDRSDRWYTVKIEEVRVFDSDDTDCEEEPGEDEEVTDEPVTRKKVKVSFPSGHYDWIDVNNTDRLSLAGRMSSEREEPASSDGKKEVTASPTTNGNGRSRSTASNGRNNSNADNGNEYQKASPLPGFGATGLTNLGNTCYMNSAVQCMAYLPLLRAYLLSAQYRTMGDLNKDNPLGTGGKLLEEFAELLRGMWSAKLAEKTPTKFKMQLAKNNAQFSGADQQDAQEFLNYIIDILHEDSNRVVKKPYVENLEDDWVAKTDLRVVGDETWKRFLRRNRSIMADVAMGQTLNTVSCPYCHYESRSFDPFNLLSIPVPAAAEAVFQCKLIRRATPRNCPWVVNKQRKHEKGAQRYNIRPVDTTAGAPSEAFVVESYVIALSRLADCGDLKLQLQNLSGIPVKSLRVCRSEEFVVNEAAGEKSCLRTFTKVFPLADKDPAAMQAKQRNGGEEAPKRPTQIIAFELTMHPRRVPEIEESEKAVKSEGDERYPSRREQALIDSHLQAYADEKEARIFDTDPTVIAKAVSRSLWPRNDSELKVGLRVDAQDHTGKFLPGSVVDIKDETVEGQDTDTGEVETIVVKRRVQVHFDNFLPKWDEDYSYEAFKKGKLLPLYARSEARNRVAEFMVSHRYTDKKSRKSTLFGLSFLVQFKTEWSLARAGAHLLLQTSRFLYKTGHGHDSQHLTDKVHCYVSDMVDLLLSKDREYIHECLGLSLPTTEGNEPRRYRNPLCKNDVVAAGAKKKIAEMIKKLPFELIVCTEPDAKNGKTRLETTYSFAVDDTFGNFINSNNVFVLQWREPSALNKADLKRVDPIMYSLPRTHTHAASADVLKTFLESQASNNVEEEQSQDGLSLEYCLTNYCKEQKLLLSDNWTCPKCKKPREAPQKLTLWKLPDLLTFHIKRFNMSARWHEKILTKVNFPMTGLDMSEWCHDGSPARGDQNVYDLIGVMNHYGSMTGGHYIATCKATLSGKDGTEEVAYGFNGRGINLTGSDLIATTDEPSHWVLGRGKAKSTIRADSALSAKAAATSAEPTWLQFDDEIVEQIPPRHIVSEMAYVLFYRKRAMNPANIAKYSTIE